MNFDFDEYMNTRVPLRFRPDGTFRILILTDPHGGSDSHPQLKPGIDAIVEAARPALLIFGGDMTGHIHYCMFKPYDTPKPDYHRPEQFAAMVLKE